MTITLDRDVPEHQRARAWIEALWTDRLGRAALHAA